MKENNFSSRLLMFRQNKNMTQEELAGRMGVTPQALSNGSGGIVYRIFYCSRNFAEY